MRKFMVMVVGVATLCGTVAFAQPTGAGQEERAARGPQEAMMLHRAIMEGKNDPATLQLLTKALTDRTAMLQAETAHVTALQGVVTAVQGGDETAIKTARDTAKTAHEAVVAAAKVFGEDLKALRDHIKTAAPRGKRHQPPATTTPAEPSN